MNWHGKSVDQVFHELESTAEGLSSAEATRRLDEHGPNEIRKGREIGVREAADKFQHFDTRVHNEILRLLNQPGDSKEGK